MRRILSNTVLGVGVGFCLGYLVWMSLALFGLPADTGRSWQAVGSLALAALGALAGGVLGALLDQPEGPGRSVARWCAGTAAVVGGLAFLAGFAGPILLRPDLPQGPLLGIFITGPLGTVAGAILGLLIGLVRQGRRAT